MKTPLHPSPEDAEIVAAVAFTLLAFFKPEDLSEIEKLVIEMVTDSGSLYEPERVEDVVGTIFKVYRETSKT